MGSSVPNEKTSYSRLDERSLSREIDGITAFNGTAFSPSGDVMYVVGRIGEQFLAYDYNLDAGRASNRSTFARVPNGNPEVACRTAIPTAGWSTLTVGTGARFSAAEWIVRYNRESAPDRVLRAPSVHSTMATLGGPDMNTMFVTTARRFTNEQMLIDEPQAGGIFACEVAAVGLAQHRFRG